jgi:hypothetical protein
MTLMNPATITGICNLACQEIWKQEAVNAIIVDKFVLDAIDPSYIEELKDNYVGYSGQTIKTIIKYLWNKWCIITTLKEQQAAKAFHFLWDLTNHIKKYTRELDKQQKLCLDIGVPAAAEATKIQHYVESMFASEMFDDMEMQAWEIKASADKTWDATKTHFVMIYKSKENPTWNAQHAPAVTKVLTAFSAGMMHPSINHKSSPTSLHLCHQPNNAHFSSIPTAWKAH